MTWTTERVELLKGWWSDGKVCSWIARQFGDVTRNAVIGKLHRLGLVGRARSYVPRPKPERKAPPWGVVEVRAVRPPPAEAQMPPSSPPDASPFACTIAGLGADMCRYPIDEKPTHDMRYCGAPSWGSWCPMHRRSVFKTMARRG